MEGEIAYFRKKFIGGFNRDDVVAYIGKVAKERNEALDEREKQGSEILRLKGELLQLQGELSQLQEKIGAYEKLIGELKERGNRQHSAAPQPQTKRPVIKIKRKKENK